MKLESVAALICVLAGTLAHAQNTSSTKPSTYGAYDWFARAGLTCGAGASTSPAAIRPTVQCGGIAGIMPFFYVEAGVMGPQANRSHLSGYVSTDAVLPLIAPSKLGNRAGVPLLIGGYTRMFETGHAVDYGIAFAHPLDESHSLQFEVRDYYAFANPSQHNVVLRVVWLVGLPD